MNRRSFLLGIPAAAAAIVAGKKIGAVESKKFTWVSCGYRFDGKEWSWYSSDSQDGMRVYDTKNNKVWIRLCGRWVEDARPDPHAWPPSGWMNGQ